MIPPQPKRGPWKTAFVVGVTISAAFAVLFGVTAFVLYSDISHISPCDDATGASPCLGSVGFGVEEWEHGVLANGTYTYRFVVFPVGVYQLNSSGISITFQNSYGGNVAPESVSIVSLQGAPVVSYELVGSGWTAAQSVAIGLPSVLTFSSSTSLVDDAVTMAYPAAHYSISIGIY
jgi:hypothetical protein